MKKENVLDFLKEHPDFLAEHADELGIRLKDDKMRSFAQAQLTASRLKIEKMAAQLHTMLADAETNRSIMLRQSALNIKLLQANTVSRLVQALYESLQHDFKIHHFRLILVAEPKNKIRIPEKVRLPSGAQKARAEIEKLREPVLGAKISAEMRALLPDSGTVWESFLQLPIPVGGVTGAVLLAADEDVHRFAADLETETVDCIAGVVGAALSRMMGY